MGEMDGMDTMDFMDFMDEVGQGVFIFFLPVV
jgi:hypothetical protein